MKLERYCLIIWKLSDRNRIRLTFNRFITLKFDNFLLFSNAAVSLNGQIQTQQSFFGNIPRWHVILDYDSEVILNKEPRPYPATLYIDISWENKDQPYSLQHTSRILDTGL